MNNLKTNITSRQESIDLAQPTLPAKNVSATSPLIKEILGALNSRCEVDQIKAIGVLWGKEETSMAGFSKTLGDIKKNFLGQAPTSPADQNANTNFCLYVTKQICQELGPPLGPQIRQLLNEHQSAAQISDAAQPALLQAQLATLLGKMEEALVPNSGIDLSQCLEKTGLIPAKKTEQPATNPTSQAIIIKDAEIRQQPEAIEKFHNKLNAESKSAVGNQTSPAPKAGKETSNQRIGREISEHQTAMSKALETLGASSFKDSAAQAFKEIKTAMENYSKQMQPNRGPAQKTLINEYPDAIRAGVASIKVYSNLDQKNANAIAFKRDLVNIKMETELKDSNLLILGCEQSQIRSNKKACKPGNEVSLAMRAPIQIAIGETKRPVILSVAAPALDVPNQPEWNQYVEGAKFNDKNQITKHGKLNTTAYTKAMNTLAQHIKQCANDNPGHRVVLSGYGLNNFITGLSKEDIKKAQKIGVDEMAELVNYLQFKGIKVAFTALYADDQILAAIKEKQDPNIEFDYAGRIPGEWINDTDIIVNAWDPHSLVGNGCSRDISMDGFVGRSSLTHEIHAVACNLFDKGLLTQVNQTV